ncbi:MAG: site-specific integrase [Actinomycetota bacterium]|nr:site-specific integrase [Actinomycetota bacterium]
MVGDLCTALWDAGEHPQICRMTHLVGLDKRAVELGFGAWRAGHGFGTHFPRWANPTVGSPAALAAVISPDLRSAPFTCFDPQHAGRWPAPHPRIVAYVRAIDNPSLRDLMALYAVIKAGLGDVTFYPRLCAFVVPLRKLLVEEQIAVVQSIDPDDLLFRVFEKRAGLTLSDSQRSWILLAWNTLSNVFQGYADQLSPTERDRLARFFIKPLHSRHRMNRYRPSIIRRDGMRERVKAKTDVVHAHFHTLRFVARIRCQQARRLYDAVTATQREVLTAKRPLPHDFSYEETVATATGRPIRQRVLLTLWDAVSLWDHAVSRGLPVALRGPAIQRRQRKGRFAPSRARAIVQYRGVEPLGPLAHTAPFWFLDFYDHHAFSERTSRDVVEGRQAFFARHGYTSRRSWEHVPGLVKSIRRDMAREATFLQREHAYRFLHYEGIYATSLFAHFVVRMQTITGARIGEVQQIAQSPHCITQLVNVGPKSATRWILRMAPKGHKERADYFIDPDTKDLLVEVLRFLRARLHVKKLPIVSHESPKYAPDRYLLQWNGKALGCAALNTVLRFLLHDIALTPGGKSIHLTTHLLRHGFATEMASLHVPADIIARLLHQRHVEVTQYYARPTKQQVVEAAELLFVDRIDVAAEAVRHPAEIGQLLRDAEGQIGALSEVLGGTCVVGNMCPAKFACIGCAGNAPDPNRRDQVDTKRRWAEQQIRWTTKEGLYAEQRQMTQLVRDCDVVLHEMDLIAAARKDDQQAIVVQHRSGDGKSSHK